MVGDSYKGMSQSARITPDKSRCGRSRARCRLIGSNPAKLPRTPFELSRLRGGRYAWVKGLAFVQGRDSVASEH
jgi:hypothetical protein